MSYRHRIFFIRSLKVIFRIKMKKVPSWIQEHRDSWEYRGQKRPPFAITPSEGQESVWDYPRPPKITIDQRQIIVRHKDTIIAATTRAFRITETASPPTYYIPQEDIDMELLEEAVGSSHCEWKGAAAYWDITLPSTTFKNAAWSYPDPYEEFIDISNSISFYPAILDCYIDDEKVRPQPGGFYGGWITNEIVGPVKGEIPEASL
ncbi:hypothetical protein DCS32_11215 [Dokdonia sp. Dokd-P16]|nr:hypothetical protein DCS32_11215 [Dokdonia sp. Dokd-P16]